MVGVHRVRQLRWQASAVSAADGFALRTLLRERGDALQAALGRAFDAIDPGEQVLHLPRLELAMAAEDLEALDEDFELRLEAVAREALARVLAAPLRSTSELGTGAAEAQAADHNGRAAGAPGAPGAPRVSDAGGARREALRHYLARGLLHWTQAGLASEHADSALRQGAVEALGVASVPAAEAWADLVDPGWPWARRVGALLRWLTLLTPSQRRAWVTGLDSVVLPPEGLGAWHELVNAADIPLDLLALWLAAQNDGPAPSGARAMAVWAQATQRWLDGVAASHDPSHLRERLQASLRILDGTPAAPPAAGEPAEGPTEPTRHSQLAPDRFTGVAPPAVLPGRGPNPARDPDSQLSAGLLVPLAGLVLLHPYLPRLLAACGLYTAGQRCLAPEHLPRACAVMRALADARDEVHEHELPFVKLLLGAEPDEPLPNPLPASPHASVAGQETLPRPISEPFPALIPALVAAERDEVAAVLEAARSHWSALRGTSVEGLRSSFLQRRGLLERADGAWRLRLQTAPWDMLVALLPWSIGFVKLPWMARPLVVEWPTP